MEIRLLKYFLAVANEENITRAAKTLHIAQPSLSKQIIELENSLGKKLFWRGKRRVTLTPAGQILKKRADEIITLCHKTAQEVACSNKLIHGEITIAGAANCIIAQAIEQMLTKYPCITFKLLNGDAVQIAEYIENGLIDLAILLEPVDLTYYEHIPLPDSAKWGIYMRYDQPLAAKEKITTADLYNAPLIIPQRIGLKCELSEWLGRDIDSLNIIATFDILFNNPVTLIKAGVGYAFGLDTLIDTANNSTIIFRPLSPAIINKYGLVWKRNIQQNIAVKKYLEEINSILKNN